ncbi:MAG: right-handed parallel beta-helix repeat-containing protein [Lentisphaerae bacterium]|jgi:hypothetical protein|nr:right-handed parallel beta-helix repeat-containing protein [Lentisphaerota bacterium]
MTVRLSFILILALGGTLAQGAWAQTAFKLEQSAAAEVNPVAARTRFSRAAEQRLSDAKNFGGANKSVEIPAGDDFGGIAFLPASARSVTDTRMLSSVAAALDYERAGKRPEASKAGDAAMRMIPTAGEACQFATCHTLGGLYLRNGETRKARWCADKALETVKGDARAERRRAALALVSEVSLAEANMPAVIAAQTAIVRESGDPATRLDEPKRLIEKLLLRGRTAEAAAVCRGLQKAPALTDDELLWLAKRESEIHVIRGDIPGALAASERTLNDVTDKGKAIIKIFENRARLQEPNAAWDWFAKATDRYATSPSEKRGYWSRFGYQAFLYLRPDQANRAKAELAKYHLEPGHYQDRWLQTPVQFEKFARFPRLESEIVFPRDAGDFGVKAGKRVIASSFGYNASDASGCLQRAIDSGATTVVIDAAPGPWRISRVKPRSNQNLVFEKGVAVLGVGLAPVKDDDLFILNNVMNVALVGEGDKPDDVYIGKYRTHEEKLQHCRDYGGSGISFDGTENVVVRNMKIAECSMDGLCFGGLGKQNTNIYIENVILDGNHRQAASICAADGLYFKNVAFLNTHGGQPMCGIDLETSYELQMQSNIYLFDCVLEGNSGGGLNFTTSSYYPVTLHAKRCTLKGKGEAAALTIFARCGVYMNAMSKAHSRILIEDSTIEGSPWFPVVRFETSAFFDVEFRNVKIIEQGAAQGGSRATTAPVRFTLNREYNLPEYTQDRSKEGSVVFKGVQIFGYDKQPVVAFLDTAGQYSVTRISGRVVHNGRSVDMSRFRHIAPDDGLAEIAAFDPESYQPPTRSADNPAEESPSSFSFFWKVPWFVHTPVYTAIYWDGISWKTEVIGKEAKFTGARGRGVAFYAKGPSSVLRLVKSPSANEGVLYFDVPPGKPCTFKATGEMRLSKVGGGMAGVYDPAKDMGMKHFTVKASGIFPETWCVKFKSNLDIKFFAPLSGIVAEKPEWLPRAKAVPK